MSDASTSELEVPRSQDPLPETAPTLTSTCLQHTPTVDASVFAGTTQFSPILNPGTGVSHLTFVPLGGTFTLANPPPIVQSQSPAATIPTNHIPIIREPTPSATPSSSTVEPPAQSATTPPLPPPRNPSLSRVSRIATGRPGDLGDRIDPQQLEILWRRAKAATAFYWAWGQRFPSQLGQVTINHARTMIKELDELDAPPTTLRDFMPPHKIINKVDDLLFRRLEACLPDLTPFLTEQPSRESGPHSCLEAPRGADKVLLEPSKEATEVFPAWKSQEGQVWKADWNPQEGQYA